MRLYLSSLPKMLVKPISAELKVVLNKRPFALVDVPKIALDFVMKELCVTLEQWQYRSLLEIADYIDM
jgi:Vacuolar sorting-associated protein 13, extended-chorein